MTLLLRPCNIFISLSASGLKWCHSHLHFCNIAHLATMYFKLRIHIPTQKNLWGDSTTTNGANFKMNPFGKTTIAIKYLKIIFGKFSSQKGTGPNHNCSLELFFYYAFWVSGMIKWWPSSNIYYRENMENYLEYFPAAKTQGILKLGKHSKFFRWMEAVLLNKVLSACNFCTQYTG